MTNMVKALKEKVGNMQDQMEGKQRDVNYRKNTKEMLEMKDSIGNEDCL